MGNRNSGYLRIVFSLLRENSKQQKRPLAGPSLYRLSRRILDEGQRSGVDTDKAEVVGCVTE